MSSIRNFIASDLFQKKHVPNELRSFYGKNVQKSFTNAFRPEFPPSPFLSFQKMTLSSSYSTSIQKRTRDLNSNKTKIPLAPEPSAISFFENTPLKMNVFLTSSFLLAPYALPFPSLALLDSSKPPFGSLYELSDLDPNSASLLSSILGPLFSLLIFLFIIRIVMSWYPQLPVNKFPFLIAFLPTEVVLRPTRQLIPPVGGVDVSPVIWVAIMSFLNEILLGQQGLLVLLSQKQF